MKSLFEKLVRDHSKSLYGFAYRLCGSHDTAQDLVQETYYEAWKSIGALKEPAAAKSWIFTILRRRFSRWLRDKRRHPVELAEPQVLQEEVDLSPVNFDNDDVLQRALDSLNPDYKIVFLLVFLKGWSCREAAQHLDIPLGTVLSRIHRTRNYLKAFLKEYSQK